MAGLNLALGAIVTGVVMLFVGIYMVDATTSMIPRTSIYGTTTGANTTALTAYNNATHHMISTATRVTGTYATLAVWYRNSSAYTAGTITVLLNDVSVGTLAAANENTLGTITSLSLNAGANEINYTTTSTGNTTIANTTLTYYTTGSYTSTGNIYNSTVTTTGSVFSVLGLVLIIVGLGIGIRSLQGMSEAA